jgi:hypothetical protein
MYLTELSNEHRRQLIDVVQVFAAWRDADRKAVSGKPAMGQPQGR